ncbi:MAG: PadR family transcriptional regulator [Solirubrobacterales bacterium]|nr:PadR family transcriptional regulator [Solirubrobacterales bacterium]
MSERNLDHVDRSGAHEQQASAMRSEIAWALLGLVIERPSYGYELVQRFSRTYEGTLAFSGAKRIYTAIDTLRSYALIEEFSDPAPHMAGSRRPRPHYRATDRGVRGYEEWLLSQMEDQRQRSRLFARQLAMLEPEAALEVLDHYEREWLEVADETSVAETTREALAQRLLEGEEQSALEVRIAWIEYARKELAALIAEQAKGDQGR